MTLWQKLLCAFGWHTNRPFRYVRIVAENGKRLGCGLVCRSCGRLDFHVMYGKGRRTQ